jgi:hypothetical protein
LALFLVFASNKAKQNEQNQLHHVDGWDSVLKDNRLTVSIVMPTKERFEYVNRAVKSVLAQTYQDWELLIIDDSTTETHQRILELANSDSRLQVVPREPGIGPCAARRIGVEATKGGFTTFIDSDDYYLPDRLEQHMEVWRSHPEIGLSYDSWESSEAEENSYLRKQLRYLPKGVANAPFTARRLFYGNFIHASSALTTRKIIQQAGGYPEEPLVCDWYLYMRICETYPAFRIPMPLSFKDSLAPDRVGARQASFVTQEFMAGKRKALKANPKVYALPLMTETLLFVLASLKNFDGQYLKKKAFDLVCILRP